ncbi:L-2,4-diaminobutyric acid acetyltransferase [Pseudonocardia eucalypti]|nr:L-2,4-diaminobutyric acid acetyltransferase [Pseudonocardia eucalypti]
MSIMIAAADQKIRIEKPTVADGVECWRLADESKVLDVNSKYAYLLWCRDFAETSVVARRAEDQAVVGFVTGFRRPDSPNVLLVWQVAVDPSARGEGLAVRMLDTLFHQVADVDRMETTITPDNKASIALFTAFAERNGAPIERSELFGPDLLGADHQPEHLYRIGPIGSGS